MQEGRKSEPKGGFVIRSAWEWSYVGTGFLPVQSRWTGRETRPTSTGRFVCGGWKTGGITVAFQKQFIELLFL